MSDQKPKKRRGRAVPPKSSALASPTNMRRANEQMLQNIGKLLQEREFGSAAEANDYLQQLLASGGIPTAAAANPLDRAQELMYDAWDAGGGQCTGGQLSGALKRAARKHDQPQTAVPFVLIGHSKLFTRQNQRSLASFLGFVAGTPDRFRFGTLGGYSATLTSRQLHSYSVAAA